MDVQADQIILENAQLCSHCEEQLQEKVICRKCLQVFCSSCADYKGMLYSVNREQEIQLCQSCHSKLKDIEDFLDQTQIQFNTISRIGQTWLESSGASQMMQQSDRDLQGYLKVQAFAEPQDEEVIRKDVTAGRTDIDTFHWQIQEILWRQGQRQFRDPLTRVLRGFCIRNSQIGYCQGLNYLTSWLLLFLDENSAFWMLNCLIEHLLLPDFYIGSKHGNSLNGFHVECTTLAGLLESLYPWINQAIMPSNDFCDFFCLQSFIQLFVNCIDVRSTKFIWDKLCTQGSIALIRASAALININKEEIQNQAHPITIQKKIQEQMIIQQLTREYESLEGQITEQRVNRLRESAKNYRANQWRSAEPVAIKRLEKVTHFNSDELAQIYSKFQEIIEQRHHFPRLRALKINLKRRHTVRLPQEFGQNIEGLKSEDFGINKQEFLSTIRRFNEHLLDWAEGVFDAYDEDKSGYLDFRELTVCMSVICKGSFDERMRLCFNVYDADKSGYLQMDEYHHLIQSILIPYKKLQKQTPTPDLEYQINMIEEKMERLIQRVPDEILSYNQFFNGINSDPLLYQVMSEHIGDVRQSESLGDLKRALTTSHSSKKCHLCSLF